MEGPKRLRILGQDSQLKYLARTLTEDRSNYSEELLHCCCLIMRNISDSQRVPVLSAASAKSASTATGKRSNDDMIKLITYESIAVVIRQCGTGASSKRQGSPPNNVLSGSALSSQQQGESQSGSNSSNNERTMNTEQLRKYEPRCRCALCGTYRHFKADHNADGSIKNGLPSNDNPPNGNSNCNNNGNNNDNRN